MRHTLLTLRSAAAMAALALLAPAARAQVMPAGTPVTVKAPSRVGGGFAIGVLQPVGQLREHIDVGGGFSGHVLVALDPMGIVALRGDVGLAIYGHESRRTTLAPQYGNLIRVNLNTSNNVMHAGVGLQAMAPSGPVRPYVAGTVGVGHFFTQSSIDGDDGWDDNEGFARTVNHQDSNLSLGALAGIYIPFGRSRAWGLDLGASYHSNGRQSYMTEQSISDVDGVPTAGEPFTSDARYVTYRIGIRFGR